MPSRAPRTPRRLVAALGAVCALALPLVLAPAANAAAVVPAAPVAAAPDAVTTAPTGPPPAITQQTVSTDALPTVQTNGIVWAQVVVGTTVYATGDFTSARPAGAALGTNETARGRLLAYDIRTGELIASWAPTINAVGRAIEASPDGRTIYVGGDFTAANGSTRGRFAAFDATTGALSTTLKPLANASVRTILASGNTVWFGGSFENVTVAPAASVRKPRVAAINATTGALLPFFTAANPAQVEALALTPDAARLVIGGRFQYLNNIYNPGIGWVDATSGAVLPFPANTVAKNWGYAAGYYSLTVTGDQIVGTGFGFIKNATSAANVEGMISADATTGELRWIQNCLGDSYDAYSSADGFLYLAGHPHTCANAAAFPEASPRIFRYGLAFTQDARHPTVKNAASGYAEWAGTPSPAIGNWFPTFTPGTFSGQAQAGWSVEGNDDYVVYGGEFPTVNGTPQMGLVRFARRDLAPNARGPQVTGTTTRPSAVSRARGTVQVSWPVNWDTDDATLTYTVVRDGDTANPVAVLTHTAAYWDRSRMSFTDSGLANNRSYSYTIVASDPWGNAVTSPSVSVTTTGASASPLSLYAQTVLADSPGNYWRMDDTSNVLASWTAGSNGVSPGAARGVAGVVPGDPSTAMTFTGSSSSYARSGSTETGTDTVSIEAWFRTTTTSGGKIVGMGTGSSGSSGSHDRHVWMADDGTVSFGVYPQTTKVVTSPAAYNDGAWHHVVATLGVTGQRLYLDGALVGHDPGVVSAQQPLTAYWRIGGDALGGWAPTATSGYFAGSIDEVATYNRILTPEQVVLHHTIGSTGEPPNQGPTAAVTAAAERLTVALDGTTSSDPDGTVAAWDWDLGDGSTAQGATVAHTYAEPGTYTVTLTVTDDDGATSQVAQEVTVITGLPSAQLTVAADRLTVALDASASSDPDGTLAAHDWTFGDGVTGTGATAEHTYDEPGTYTVTLTVTDDDGQVATASQDVTVGTGEPVASFTTAVDRRVLTLDAGGSSDPDGEIVDWQWDLGDGTALTGPTVVHTYDGPGAYLVTLTVTDDDGQVASATRSVMVTLADPVAGFTVTTARLAAAFDAAGSSDPDGALVSWDWDFGDGTTATGPTAEREFTAAGTYTVTLTVTDDDGRTGTTAQDVTVALAAPEASFALTSALRTVQVDGSASGDPDGTVVAWDWTFGDGATASGPTASHTFTTAGTHTVSLTVTDDSGLTATMDRTVEIALAAPSGAFSAVASQLALAVDGSASADTDGTVVTWDWDFGDGGTATGTTASHTYTAAGTYTVRLEVTDDTGLTHVATTDVTVTPAPAVLGQDTFTRALTGSLGDAEVGGAWVATAGVSSVAGGVARLSLATKNSAAGARLPGAAGATTVTRVTWATDKRANGLGSYALVRGRIAANGDEYRLKLQLDASGKVNARLVRSVSGTEVLVAGPVTLAGTLPVGGRVRSVLSVSGASPTLLQAKVWFDGQAEPAGWTLEATDTAASLQVPGHVGLHASLSSSTTNGPVVASFDDLLVTEGIG
ncbi:PKD domain-containing protein [Cellulomonas sp. S1-8]|uniref:PKD domain-containing protein n=1 Tax=Cellulomonas sp. S1-8 TaxID=2904790 RepID=UPI00224395BF|nr:PKD domain-containing protein [Cellulomonas sp. S1-8]UZN04309.1 PKD domain-containing protein [Cellulomonas sp. S1-8]